MQEGSYEEAVEIKIDDILAIAYSAGKEIMEVYDSDFSVALKEDRTPLTTADKRSHQLIFNRLSSLYAAIPVLSEEGRAIPYNERKEWNELWIVDPLDGTKEFINKNGEFTVNIAMLRNSVPVLGVIYLPVMDIFYFAEEGKGAYRISGTEWKCLHSGENIKQSATLLPVASDLHRQITAVASRSHMSDETLAYLDEIRGKHGNISIVSAGSSLKFCMVAEGRADIYPRFGPTMEWDTAAGQAIATEAGGTVISLKTNNELVYNKSDLLNPSFIVRGPRFR